MFNPPLTDIEVRILGSLAEKAVTTPDNYPLSLSALTAACNQTTSREPVMRLEEGIVAESIVPLRRRSLLRAMQPAGSRVTKYLHLLDETLNLDAHEIAVLGVLMLRGPQTIGELHTRTTRLAEFPDVATIEATLHRLISREAGVLVALLPKRAGQKEVRYAHLLNGEPGDGDVSGEAGISRSGTSGNAADGNAANGNATNGNAANGTSALPGGAPGTADRVAELERVVAELRSELAELQAQFTAFRAEFQ